MGILPDGLYLLRCLNTVLHLAESFEIVRLLLRDFEFQRSHFLVLAARHLFGGRLQRFARSGQFLTDPRTVSDADGQSHDAEKFHYVHRPTSKHHHPALVGTHTKGEAQAYDTGVAHGVAQHRRLRKSLHRHQQLLKALVNRGQSHGE